MRLIPSRTSFPGLALYVCSVAVPVTALPLGPDVSDCRSVLRTGPTNCNPTTSPDNTFDVVATGTSTHALDIKIDQYLMQYGKPPREAIRALLDPSDENILAMMRQQQAAVDRAEYVAWRMTQLQTLTGTPSSFGQTIRSSPPGSHAP